MKAQRELGFAAIMRQQAGWPSDDAGMGIGQGTADSHLFLGQSRAVVDQVRAQIAPLADGQAGAQTEPKRQFLAGVEGHLLEWFKGWEHVCLDEVPLMIRGAAAVLNAGPAERVAAAQSFAGVLKQQISGLEALAQKSEQCDEDRLAAGVLLRRYAPFSGGNDPRLFESQPANPLEVKDFQSAREVLDKTLAAAEKAMARIQFVHEESRIDCFTREEWIQISDSLSELKGSLRAIRRSAMTDELARGIADALNPHQPKASEAAPPKEERLFDRL